MAEDINLYFSSGKIFKISSLWQMSTSNVVLLFFYFLAEVSTSVPLICTLFQKLIFFGIGFVSQNQGKLAYFSLTKVLSLERLTAWIWLLQKVEKSTNSLFFPQSWFVLKHPITERLFSAFLLTLKWSYSGNSRNISDGLIFICFGQLWVSKLDKQMKSCNRVVKHSH